jgi:hypothetical protein
MEIKYLRQLVGIARRHELTWRYAFNLGATLPYKFNSQPFEGETARVLGTLNREGVAVTSVDKLLSDVSLYTELKNEVAAAEEAQRDEINRCRTMASETCGKKEKSFIHELLGTYPAFDPDSIYAKFALQKPVLQLANAYFGMYTRLRYYNVWRTFATQSEARASQLWHQDREDFLILKMFVYLSDIDDGAGPFTYAAGTHPKGMSHQAPNYFMEGNVKRSADQQMAAVVPADRWVKAVGRAGTIVFADTRGYHKGGLARERDRLMYTCMFTSQASQSKEFMLPPEKLHASGSRELRFALDHYLTSD